MKNNRINLSFAIAVYCLLMTTACSAQQGQKKAEENNSETQEEMVHDIFGSSTPAEEPREDEFLGNQVLNGKLKMTKGAQAMVDGVILVSDFYREKGTKGWNAEFEALKGKRVEIKGDVWRHHCRPEEQCLQQGYIDTMRSLDYINAK